jgi:hypothetical protein
MYWYESILTYAQEWGGWFEVDSGQISPPPSPRATAAAAKDYMTSAQLLQSRSGDAAYNITEECERLFCETLRTAFLVEKNAGAARNSLVMGTLEQGRTDESVADLSSKTPPYDHGGHAVGMPVQTTTPLALGSEALWRKSASVRYSSSSTVRLWNTI